MDYRGSGPGKIKPKKSLISGPTNQTVTFEHRLMRSVHKSTRGKKDWFRSGDIDHVEYGLRTTRLPDKEKTITTKSNKTRYSINQETK